MCVCGYGSACVIWTDAPRCMIFRGRRDERDLRGVRDECARVRDDNFRLFVIIWSGAGAGEFVVMEVLFFLGGGGNGEAQVRASWM